MFNTIYQKINEFNKIIIHRHTKPDGDALGAQLGLKHAILATFPDKLVYAVGEMIERFNFVEKMDEVSDDVYEGALVIVLDCGGIEMISDLRYDRGAYLIKIDHHIARGSYGDLVYVDTSRESCAGMIASLIEETPLVLTKEAAEYCLLGIITDSGRFRYPSTSIKTFNIVTYLYGANPDIETIYNNIYTENYHAVCLKAKLTLKFEKNEFGLAYLKNTAEEVEEMGLDCYAISRGMVNVMAGIEGIEVWANFTETPEGKVLVELRSKSKNINPIATKYGGGGHLLASGATINGWSEVDLMINDLNKVAGE